jgi:hypothetical protein
LLDHGGVLLDGLVHLVDGGVDLVEAGGLFLARGGDLADQAVDLADLADDGLQGLARLADHRHALADLLARGRDQGLDLLGGVGRALGQGPHFLGDDREAATGFTGPGRLDAGVQGQQVGLEGDLVDDADDLADRLRRLLDLVHGLDGVADDDGRAFGVRAGRGDDARGFLAPADERFTVAVISSRAAAVSSRLAACCSLRRDRSSAAEAISSEPEPMPLAAWTMVRIASSSWVMAPLKSLCRRW